MADIISFDTGLKEYDLNGAVMVKFNPTSVRFAGQLFEGFDAISKVYEEYKDKIAGVEDAEAFDLTHEVEHEIIEALNNCFGCDISGLFADIGPVDIANGLPVWMNLMLAVIDTLDSSLAEEKKKTNPRIKKYTDKYKKR